MRMDPVKYYYIWGCTVEEGDILVGFEHVKNVGSTGFVLIIHFRFEALANK